jgi:kinesin family protein 2/24
MLHRRHYKRHSQRSSTTAFIETMASSATLTTTHLPQLRIILEKWNQTRTPSTGFSDIPVAENASKEVIVAFRTRPPLANEATDKFQSQDSPATDIIEFCPGITAISAEPGVFVAHVPGMKVPISSLTVTVFNAI